MKQLIILWLLFSNLTVIFAQDSFVYFEGKKRYLEVSPNKIIVQFDKKMTIGSIKDAIKKNTSYELSDISTTDYEGLYVLSFSDTDKDAIMRLANQWKNKDAILYSGFVFIDKDGEKTSAITNQINVRLKQEDDYPILQKSIMSYDIAEVERNVFDSRTYLLTLSYSSQKNAMQIANELYEEGMFEYAEPNLLLFIRYETNDAYFSQQWGLNNTGQHGGTNGIDINANQAWTVTTGSPNIKIAILDTGVDPNHPDLINNLLPGYVVSGGYNVFGHGTSCAGIAAAQGNNNIGIAGVAYNCSILPICMGDTPYANRVADGLDWARENGANVVSMSFSTDTTDAVKIAISNAVSSGCVLVAAAGNYFPTQHSHLEVNFPANRADVIAVGAISYCGERKSLTSCDGDTIWGSSYGSQLDMVAPGISIPTTAAQSTYPYPGYRFDFGGTSAACPHVAGVAALILSVNPTLTSQQVRNIIKSTAQKVRPDLYTYSTTSEHPNGTWNIEMGYGLVDAYAAVQNACSNINISNKTIIANATVNGCNNVSLKNVSVQSNAKLTVNAPGTVSIEGPFSIYSGSQFEVK